MKKLQLILKNKWHLHMPIGNVIMGLLLLLMTLSSSLGYFGQALFAGMFLFFGCWLFEFWQDTKLPEGEKQSDKAFYGDVAAGVIGGVASFLSILIGGYVLQIIVSIVLLLIGAGLQIYKIKNKK